MKHIAKALSNLGRNGDSELVHMTKGEVVALDNAARSHGLGSLPVNPHTGLREANILDSLQHAPDTFREFQHATTTGSPWQWGRNAIYYTDPTSRLLQGTGHQGAAGAYANTAAAIGMLYSAGAGMGLTGTSGSAGTAGTTGTEAAFYTSPSGYGTAGMEGTAANTTGAAANAGAAATPTGGMSGTTGASPTSYGSLTDQAAAGGNISNASYGLQSSAPSTMGSGSVGAGDASMMGVGSGGEPTGPSTTSKVLSWMGNHPYETVWAANAVGQMLDKPKKQEPHQVEFKGQTTTSSNATDSPYNYTSAPSTYVTRYAQGGTVRGYADGGMTTVNAGGAGPTASQYASLGIAQPQPQQAQAPAAPQGGIASLPQAQAQPQQQWQDPTMTFNQSWSPPAQQASTANATPQNLMDPNSTTTGAPQQNLTTPFTPPTGPLTTTSGWMNQAIANSPSVQAQKKKEEDAAAAAAAAAAQRAQQQQQQAQAQLARGQGTNADSRERYRDAYVAVHGVAPPRTSAGNADARERQRQQQTPAQLAAAARARQDRRAKGGILNLRPHGQHLAPAFLSGPGDGMSDDIQANIQGSRGRPGEPVRVADGEYIVPADVVAHLGNGSSNAGAKKLEQMSARVRKARTGKTSQAPQVKTDRFIPK